MRRNGTDVTIVAISTMVRDAITASKVFEQRGVNAEVIDLRTVKPWDRELVFSSIAKTGRLVIADAAWKTGSVAAEIAATVAEGAFQMLKAPIVRVCLPDAPAPTSASLERAYYLGPDDIVSAVEKVLAF